MVKRKIGDDRTYLSIVAERMVSVRPCLNPEVLADSYVDAAESNQGNGVKKTRVAVHSEVGQLEGHLQGSC